jgi:arabinose-5-phosphate isomerase
MSKSAPAPALPADDAQALLERGRSVVRTEAAAIAALEGRMGDDFVRACRLMLACQGRVVTTGMGKSGHIARKIAATMASAGTPAFFLHPAEASHGDMGMITRGDVVLALSNSGETNEILAILPLIKRLGAPLITLTGNAASRMAHEADVNIDVSVEQEACPLGLAPTASTSAALCMGDALSIAMLQARGFGPEDFARSHPGGRLGRRLLLRIRDIMHSGDGVPSVPRDAMLSDALMEMTGKSLGMTAVVDASQRVLGVFTDGDLRRALDRVSSAGDTPIVEVMTPGCVTVTPDMLVAEALKLMEERSINGLLVTDEAGRLCGALNMLDLLRADVV